MSSVLDHYRCTMTDKDKVFFEKLGLRIAKLRKDQGMTQGQLAEFLSISQQHMASFEKGIRKVPASMLPKLATLFRISLDELVGADYQVAKRGAVPKLQRQVEQIRQMPRNKQRLASDMLEAIIQQQAS